MVETVRFRLNGRPVEISVDPSRMLLWVLRSDLTLTGTKYGCGEALCGACTVLVNGEVARSCTTPMGSLRDAEILTVEGLAPEGGIHPVQAAFVTHDALQCGYCTPGMVMGAYGLLLRNPRPTEDEIVEAMEGHLCRCGTYQRIVAAVLTASEAMARGGISTATRPEALARPDAAARAGGGSS